MEGQIDVQKRGVLTISKSLNTKDITEVNSCFCLTDWARAIQYFVIREDKLVSDSEGSIIDKGGTKCYQNNGIEANNWLDEFESNSKPDNTEDCADWEVQKVVAKVVGLVCRGANPSIFWENEEVR